MRISGGGNFLSPRNEGLENGTAKPCHPEERSDVGIASSLKNWLTNKRNGLIASSPYSPIALKAKTAFTLAEVLITLGIIGVVAAMTLPALTANFQKMVLKNQFKKQYSQMQEAVKRVEGKLEYVPYCFSWTNNPYGEAVCSSYNENGECTQNTLADGSDLPDDYTGKSEDCDMMQSELKKTLKVIKVCENNALANGCIPAYKGNDTVFKDNNPNASGYDQTNATTDCRLWREETIRNNTETWVWADGTILITYGGKVSLFALDINGKKGPNKWGHDIFTFNIKNDGKSSNIVTPGGCGFVEKGGISPEAMMKEVFKK